MKRVLAILLTASVLAAGGCATATSDAGSDDTSATSAAGAVDDLLVRHDLDGLDTVDLIDRLDRLAGDDRPQELMASVRPDRLVLTVDDDEVSRELPADRFYLSVAPYVSSTHDCFNHSLTTCTGELADTPVRLEVVEQGTGEVLIDEERTTFANGFVGLWLPRDIEATLTVTSADGSATAEISTDDEALTCLTTLQLA